MCPQFPSKVQPNRTRWRGFPVAQLTASAAPRPLSVLSTRCRQTGWLTAPAHVGVPPARHARKGMSACARLDPAHTGQTPRPPRLGEPIAPHAPQSAMINVAVPETATRQTPQASFGPVPALATLSRWFGQHLTDAVAGPDSRHGAVRPHAPDGSFLRPIRRSRPRPRRRFEPHRR